MGLDEARIEQIVEIVVSRLQQERVDLSAADIVPSGTGAVTDVGMTGSFDSILGVRKDEVIARFLSMRPTRFEVAGKDVRCDYVIADIDDETGRTRAFTHHQLLLED